MEIQRLYIKRFRNIHNLELDLSKQKGLSVLIGNNGSGKSNILEAVVAIFASLYNHSKEFEPEFEYEIEYIEDDHCIKIEGPKRLYYIDNQPTTMKVVKGYLPKNIIATYSGETLRLQEHFFIPFRRKFVRNKLHGKKEDLKLLFINKDMWEISLLTLFLYPFDVYKDITDFCYNLLNVKNIHLIHFELDPYRLKHHTDVKLLIDSISPLKTKRVSHSLEQFQQIVDSLGFSPKDTFLALYIGLYSCGIKGIHLEIESMKGELFLANLLSEGEKKLLSIFTMLEVLADERSLMIYDEPDSQIHISRKAEIKKLIEKYANRQHIITTHSPTLAAAFFDSSEHLNCLTKNADGCTEKIDKDKCALIAELTDNIWNVSDQNTFLASNKPITLLVEGKTDKIHVEEAFKRLKSDYPELDFDVFHFGGATNIPQFITGLKTCEIDFSNRVIVAVFDNDKEGRDCCNQTQVKYIKGKKNIYGLYALTLPLTSDGTIENMYDQSKYDAAFKTVVTRNTFNGIVSKYAESITKQAKIELSNNAREFADDDFDKFKALFDKIKEIKLLV